MRFFWPFMVPSGFHARSNFGKAHSNLRAELAEICEVCRPKQTASSSCHLLGIGACANDEFPRRALLHDIPYRASVPRLALYEKYVAALMQTGDL